MNPPAPPAPLQLLRALALTLVLAAASTAAAPAPCGAASSVTVLPLPSDALTPDAVFDAAAGRLHVVFGTAAKDAFYAFADAPFAQLSPPVKLNTAGLGVTTTMGERGPKLARSDADGALHAVYSDLWAPGVRTHARSVTRRDGGATWLTPLHNTPDDFFGADGLSVAAGGAGGAGKAQVVVTYHVNSSAVGPTNATSATWLFSQVSLDGGASWAAPQLVEIAGGAVPAVACSMCMTQPRFDAAGSLLIAFRSATADVREFYVVAGSALTNSFAPSKVNATPWAIDYCPMNGPTLSLLEAGKAAVDTVAYMQGDANNVFWSSSSSGYALRVPTPRSEANERYATAVASNAGDVLMVWQVGPMAVSGTATVKWACYATNGTLYERQGGVLGTSFAGTKATAVAVADAAFVVLTTAR